MTAEQQILRTFFRNIASLVVTILGLLFVGAFIVDRINKAHEPPTQRNPNACYSYDYGSV